MKVKKQGWINIHKWPKEDDRYTGGIYESQEEAMEWSNYDEIECPCVSTIQIEWEEEI